MENFNARLGAVTLITLAPAMFFATPAWAVGPTPLAQAMADVVSGTIMPLIAAVVAAFAVIALRRLAAKLGVEGLLAHEGRVKELAHQGIALAEEYAAARIKKQAVKLPGGEKLNMAVAHILSMVPEISREQAEVSVHAALGRLSGVGASGETAI